MHFYFRVFLFILISSFFVSCSHFSSHSNLDQKSREGLSSEGIVEQDIPIFDFHPPLEIEISGTPGTEEYRFHLESLVEQAQELGPLQRDYLSRILFLKASNLSMREESELSALYLSNILKLNPQDDLVLRKYAVELIRLGQLGEAEKIVTQIFESVNRGDENIALILGGIYVAIDRRDKAQEIYREVLKMNPSNQEACVFLAKSYAMDSQFDRADKSLNNCYELTQSEQLKAIYAYYRGSIAMELENTSRAIKFFKSSLVHNPEFFQAAMALGMIYEEREQWDDAMKAYMSYLENDSLNRGVLSQLVQISFRNGEYEQVLPYAKRLIHLDPSNLNLRVRVAVIYADMGKYEPAIGMFKSVLEYAPDADKVLYYVGSLYQEMGLIDHAVTYFSQIPEDSSLFHEGIIQIGEMLSAKAQHIILSREGRQPADDSIQFEFIENPEKELHEFVQYHSMASNRPSLSVELHVILASFYEELFDYKKASRALEEVLENEFFTEHHQYYYAALLERAGQRDEALSIIQKILDDHPNHAHALNFLGYSMIENNENLSEAYKLIKRAIELEPEDAYIRDSLGWYYYKRGNLEQARIEIEKAKSMMQSPDMVIVKHLAIIYKEMKEYDKAKQLFHKALSLCKRDSEKERIQEYLGELQGPRLPASKE